MDNDDFREKIALKPYLKYNYQAVSVGPKREHKIAFLKAINDSLNHLYGENRLRKRDYYFFILKKSNIMPFNK